MQIENDGIDVIVRFHDVRRVQELARAVFSLVGQEMRPLRILLVLQRMSLDEVEAVETHLAPLLAMPDAPGLTILRYNDPLPIDARSVLINIGFAAATARYLAILDYDDVLYPEAYRMLVGRLRQSGAGIAFGKIGVKLVNVFPDYVQPTGVAAPFRGDSLADLFAQNFCPIHSFVIDRERVPLEEQHFDASLTIEEDYEFLMRVCARVVSDFYLIKTQIGEYYYKSDDSNTVARRVNIPDVVLSRIRSCQAFNEARRKVTILSEDVQKSLGLPFFQPELTIDGYLQDRLG